MGAKEDLFNYVVESPENTNPAVLKSLINAPDLKEVETIELTFEEAQRLISGSPLYTIGGQNVSDIVSKIQGGKPMPILKLPYKRPSNLTETTSACCFVGNDPINDKETLMWTLGTQKVGIENYQQGYYYRIFDANYYPEPAQNQIKFYYIVSAYKQGKLLLRAVSV